ncbi:hypothetical protein AB0933_06545 [Streptomyces venezuelae]|uniref:hypothetical protein n=1 Tax=Streptomyces venezuelae TaxID=54571 RepID=UPI003452A3E6
MLLVVSCSAGENAVKVEVGDIAGRWVESEGGSIALSVDRTFKASGLESDAFADDGCPAGAAAGTWGFYVDKSESLSVVSKKATSGSEVGLSFDGGSEGAARSTSLRSTAATRCAPPTTWMIRATSV